MSRYLAGAALLAVSAIAAVAKVAPVHATEISDDAKEVIRYEIRRRLTDPDSAQFRWLDRPDNGTAVYCGFVNSRNRLGGYVGFVPFVTFLAYDTKWTAVVFDIGDTDFKYRLVTTHCTNQGFDMSGPTVDD